MRRTPWLLSLALVSLAACAPPKKASVPPVHVAPPVITAEPAPPPPPPPPPRPTIAAHDLVGIESAATSRFVKAEQASEIVVRLRLTAKTLKDAPRPPLNLGLVVDTSGSMEGDAIRDARAACLLLVDSLAEGDRISVVAFHSDAEVLVPMTQITRENRPEIRDRIRAMQAHGTTEMAGGLSLGLAEVTKGFQNNGVNRIVLLGDGVPNNESTIVSLAQSAAQRMISITALGLGLDYNETLMNAVAQHSGGKYHFIKESSQVASVFENEVLRLRRVVGRGASLKLRPGPGVTIKEVVGLAAAQEGAGRRVQIGDLSENDKRDVLVKLSAPGRRAGAVVELLDTELAFSEGDKAYKTKLFVSVRSTADAKEIEASRDRDVERTAARIGVADLIVRAVASARAGNAALGVTLLESAEKEAIAALKLLDDDDLRAKLSSIKPLKGSLATLARQQQREAALIKQHRLQQRLGRPRVPDMAPRPMPAMAPAAAAAVMKSHADATRTIQGR